MSRPSYKHPRHELYQRDESPAMNRQSKCIIPLILCCMMVLLMPGCRPSPGEPSSVQVQIEADQRVEFQSMPLGSTVNDAIQAIGIEVGLKDEVTPPGYTLLTDGMEIKITRITEHLDVETVVLAFQRQIIKNESIPKGETRLLQPGRNGLEEITYRIIKEEGIERSRVSIQRIIIEEPIPEIIMVGTQQGYTPFTFSGKIVYVSAQNAWLIEGQTGNRRPIVSTGDLDGRILELSPDGRWLLFTRQSEDTSESINSLWIVDVLDHQAQPIDLKVENIIHYAEWSPQSPSALMNYTIAYSTVEPRPSAPGWQANNDLQVIQITDAGTSFDEETIIETNSGGQYGWWGTIFSWSIEDDLIAYSRPDSIGLVELENGTFEPLVEITPYQTRGDWAWIPPIAWGQNAELLYYVNHGTPIGIENPEASQVFDIMAVSTEGSTIGPLVPQSGMFSTISPSPEREGSSNGSASAIAFLQAISPLESETSRYRLSVMDLDASNKKSIFPSQGEMGLEPGKIVWAADGSQVGLIYQNDLWVINPALGLMQRITADGQTIAFDWSQ